MAYDGAIRYVDTGDFLQAGAQIAAVEARHAAYLNLINRDSPFPSAFDQGTKPSEIFIAAKPFLVSCPDAVARSSAACRRGCSERATRNGAASAAPLSLVGFTALHFATEPSCERPSGRECRANQSIRGGRRGQPGQSHQLPARRPPIAPLTFDSIRCRRLSALLECPFGRRAAQHSEENSMRGGDDPVLHPLIGARPEQLLDGVAR